MKIKKIFLILMVSFSFLLSSCGKVTQEECDEMDTNILDYSPSSNQKECTFEMKRNVCGNKIKEEGETFANCPVDVSKEEDEGYECSKKETEYVKAEYDYNKNECQIFTSSSVQEIIKELEMKSKYYHLIFKVDYEKPFIINTKEKNPLKIDIELFKLTPGYTMNYLKITKIQVKDKAGKILSEKDLDLSFTENLKIFENLELEFSKEIPSASKQYIYIHPTISYDFSKPREGKDPYVYKDIFKGKLMIDRLDIINPTLEE